MTRKEQIKEVAQKEMSKYPNFCITAPAFRMGAEWADSHPHWISVEEELPPITQWVLTYNPTYDEYHFDVERYGRGENLVDFGVTHWMPLPQPPKKGGKE